MYYHVYFEIITKHATCTDKIKYKSIIRWMWIASKSAFLVPCIVYIYKMVGEYINKTKLSHTPRVDVYLYILLM